MKNFGLHRMGKLRKSKGGLGLWFTKKPNEINGKINLGI